MIWYQLEKKTQAAFKVGYLFIKRFLLQKKMWFYEVNKIFIPTANRRLYESCELSNQCTGSHGANECKVIAGVKMCYCPKNTNIFEGKCLKGNNKHHCHFYLMSV